MAKKKKRKKWRRSKTIIPYPIRVQGFPEIFVIKLAIKLNCQFLNIERHPVGEQSHSQNDRVIYCAISSHKATPLPKSD